MNDLDLILPKGQGRAGRARFVQRRGRWVECPVAVARAAERLRFGLPAPPKAPIR